MQNSIKIYPDANALSQAAADFIVSFLRQVLEQKEIASLVLTGGKTSEPIYQIFGAPPWLEKIDWNRIRFFWGDERCVPPDRLGSNFGMAWNSFVSKLGISSDHIHRIKGEMEDAGRAASLYEEEIRRAFPRPGIPSLDLVLLGLGEDGHVASLFPGTTWDEERLVVANRMPQTGASRISMTPTILNNAQAVIFLVSGDKKSQALAEAIRNPASSLPASRIHPINGTLTWMVDEAAASLL